MLRKVGAFVILVGVSAPFASAAGRDLPEIMARSGNAVPECVTPGRLMAFLRMRNPDLSARYDGIATQYMRFGEQYGVRWDYAFYQMVVETGALSYWRGNRAGDVRPEQNNFAGLGATGNGEHGESFKDVETGVRAHIEHVLLYAGHPVASPVAERTRKVHEWGILDAWQHALRHPVTYSDLAGKWAPGSRAYVAMLQTIADRFEADVCHRPDPRPELVRDARTLITQGTTQVASASEAKGGTPQPGDTAGAAKTTDAAASVLSLGAELVQRVIETVNKTDPNEGRSALGAPQPPPEPGPQAASAAPAKLASVPAADAQVQAAPTAKAAAVNANPAATATATVTAKAGAGDRVADKTPDKTADKAADKPADKAGPRYALAAAAPGPNAIKPKGPADTATPPAANQKCRVWTASYGGQKSVIIRSVAADQIVNFTVLDVNVGAESREADAFIAAYAKNGKITGEYASQAQALDKAFELCPEG